MKIIPEKSYVCTKYDIYVFELRLDVSFRSSSEQLEFKYHIYNVYIYITNL